MSPTWPFLLMIGSHDMRHTGFHRLMVVNGIPRSGASHIPLPDQESMHLTDLDIGVVHRMGYAPMAKVLSTYTLMESCL